MNNVGGRAILTRLIAVIFAGFCCSSSLHAAIDRVVRDESELSRPRLQRVVQLSQVRVVTADYALIRRDFQKLRFKTDEEINAWLISSAGFISIQQTQQQDVNTKIPSERTRKSTDMVAYRPQYYNRALVFNPEPGVYLDVKGAGTTQPQQVSHGNGLMALSEAVREFLVEKKVSQIFARFLPGYQTVGTYAVLDYGFDIKHADGSSSRAGAAVRQAHRRPTVRRGDETANFFLDKISSLKIESVLRKIGMTSSGEGDWKTFLPGEERDPINLQGSNSGDGRGQVFDFGTFRFRKRFWRPTFWYPDVSNKEATPLLDPADASSFPQPDPDLAADFKDWGRDDDIGDDIGQDSWHRRALSWLSKKKTDRAQLKGDRLQSQIDLALAASSPDEQTQRVDELWKKFMTAHAMPVAATSGVESCRDIFLKAE